MTAASSGNSDGVHALLAAKAVVNVSRDDGATAISLAFNNQSIIHQLTSAGETN